MDDNDGLTIIKHLISSTAYLRPMSYLSLVIFKNITHTLMFQYGTVNYNMI